MEKIRNGIDGELTAEIFETLFPDDPELILMDFIQTGQSHLMIAQKINATDVVISHITPEYAKKLLEEFKVLRGQK